MDNALGCIQHVMAAVVHDERLQEYLVAEGVWRSLPLDATTLEAIWTSMLAPAANKNMAAQVVALLVRSARWLSALRFQNNVKMFLHCSDAGCCMRKWIT